MDQAFGTGDGSTTLFQLCRPIGTWLEPVWAPATSPAPALKNNGAVINSSGYSIGTTGLVQFSAAPLSGAVLSWSGDYYMRCRFADDKMDFERFLSLLWQAQSINLISKVYA